MGLVDISVRLDRVLLEQIGGRWNLLILGALCDSHGRARFNAIKRAVPGISQKTLTRCLRDLERSGILERKVLSESPLGVEYSFTKLGDTLETPVVALYEWSIRYSKQVRLAQERYDRARQECQKRKSRPGFEHPMPGRRSAP